MIGRPPRTRQERGTVQKLTEEQLREELEQQARNKKQEKRAQQFKEKEQNLAQLEQAGHDLHQYKEKVYQEYQDVLPVQQKAEQERAARIKLREEERLRRLNGLGSAYEQQKQTLPFQIEKQLKENLNRQNFDWIDHQEALPVPEQRQTIEQQNRSYYDQRQPQSEIRSPQYEQRQPIQQEIRSPQFDQRPYGSPPQPPSYVDNRQQQSEPRDIRQQEYIQQQQPISQQSNRSKPSQEVDFYSRFGQPQSQQSQRGQAIDSNSSNNYAMNQKLKYREELDKQIQEKKMREQQEKEQYNQQRPSSQKFIDYQQDNGIQSPQQQQVYQVQQIPQQESRRFNTERRFTSGIVDDVDKKNKQYEYAEELKRQMEEKQIRKKQIEEEEKRRQLIEKQKFEQEALLQEQLKKQEEKKKQVQIFEHQVHNKQLAKRVQNDHQQDILKKSGSQVIQQIKYDEPKQIKNEEPRINQKVDTAQSQLYDQNNNQHFQQQQFQPQQFHQPQYQQPPQYQQQYYQQPLFHQYQPQQVIDYRQMDQVQKFQQILFNDQPQQNQQNMMVHQQYLFQLQQNRKEIETVKQILEEKLRIQQLEMQNQLIIDQYQRKVYDIQKEQKMFEQEIQKLQDYIKGKQRKPLDPQIFASALFYSSIGQQDPLTHQILYGVQKPSQQSQRQHSPLQQFANQQNQFQEIPKEMMDRSPNKTQKPNQAQTIQQTFKAYTPITESMIDNDIELPAQSEYVNIEELKIGLEKSFISDFQAFKQTKKENHNNTKQNVTESQKTDTKLNDYFISQSQQIQEDINQKDFQDQLEQQDGEKETSKSVIEKLEELLNVDEQLSAQEDLQDDEMEDDEQVQSAYENEEDQDEEQGDDEQVDDEIQDEDQDEEQQDDLQEEKQDNIDQQVQSQMQPHHRTDAFEDNPEALRTNWEYQTLFRDNIKSQSKKYELRLPTGLLQQNTMKLTQHDQFYQESVHESMIEQSNIIESECYQSHDQAREVQMSQAQFDNNEIHTVIPTEEEEFIPVQKQMELSRKSKQTPKVVNVFPFENQQRKNISSVIQSKLPSQSNIPNQSKLPNQSSYINQNPLISDTMLTQYQPKTMGIKSRIESQLQKSEQQTFQQSERVENSLWKNDQNMFTYDQ
ncbi:hypothetical protein pb186bvf_018302 [Paramecium bursaria]